jgi:hypothetical protein
MFTYYAYCTRLADGLLGNERIASIPSKDATDRAAVQAIIAARLGVPAGHVVLMGRA